MSCQSWNEYFMATAYHIATRGTCPRKQVGAVVVDLKSKTIISTGYNGSLPEQDHCIDVGCHIENNHCIRTVHAETNAINQAAKTSSNLTNTAIYCTTQPCWNCLKNIIQAGITKIYYSELYPAVNHNYLYWNTLGNLKNVLTYERIVYENNKNGPSTR